MILDELPMDIAASIASLETAEAKPDPNR